jgi:o-succinylbenzoate synthase
VTDLVEHRLRLGDRDVVLLEGPAGWGEVSSVPGYPCNPRAARRAAEEAARDGWPAARRDEVPVNALVEHDLDVPACTGFPAVKVKLRSAVDIDRVAAVRDLVGPEVQLRVDANGAWDVDTATDLIPRLGRLGVELVEQPVAALDDLARVRRRVQVPIAADESVRSVADARELRRLDAADAVVLKVQPLGGVRAALAVAEAAGLPAIPTSMMETSVGLSAGLALAAALPDLSYACGLATAARLPADVTHDRLVPVGGVLEVRRVAPDPELLARYTVDASQSVRRAATSSGRSRWTA